MNKARQIVNPRKIVDEQKLYDFLHDVESRGDQVKIVMHDKFLYPGKMQEWTVQLYPKDRVTVMPEAYDMTLHTEGQIRKTNTVSFYKEWKHDDKFDMFVVLSNT